jgi:gamma-glutamyltranspeptidase/glutathione hydrolase
MNIQEACEAPNITSYQMCNSFDPHDTIPGKIDLQEKVPAGVRDKLKTMGYNIVVKKYTSGPINAIFFDWKHGTFWGGSSNYGDDYGVVW